MKKTVLIAFCIASMLLSSMCSYGYILSDSIVAPASIYVPDGLAFYCSKNITYHGNVLLDNNTKLDPSAIYFMPQVDISIPGDIITNAKIIILNRELSPSEKIFKPKNKKIKDCNTLIQPIENSSDAMTGSLPYSKNSNRNKLLGFAPAVSGMHTERGKAGIAGARLFTNSSWSQPPAENQRQSAKNGRQPLKKCLQQLDGQEAFCRPPPMS